ncbi:MAG: FUSC family protein [Cellulomonadaceae bacterium]|nr:FUSC family protein [Cellulomonadaceae bacterium]
MEAGILRAKRAFWPILQACVAAALAYQLSSRLFGHAQPFFAAIAAWMCLGWSFDRDIRRAGEIALGVTLGVALGDLVVRTIGSGWWQLTLVLAVSALLARLFDAGALFTTQAGAQAIVIAGLPTITGGPYARALDAVVGSAVALLFVICTPNDPRGSLRAAAGQGAAALAATARMLSAGVLRGDTHLMAAALEQGRSFDQHMDQAITTAGEKRRRSRLTINRKYLPEISRLERQNVMLERAMRSLRVLARRLQYDSPAAPAAGRAQMAALLSQYADTTGLLGDCLSDNRDLKPVRAAFLNLTTDLDAATDAAPNLDPAIQTGHYLMRAVLGDTMEAAEFTNAEVLTALPPRT